MSDGWYVIEELPSGQQFGQHRRYAVKDEVETCDPHHGKGCLFYGTKQQCEEWARLMNYARVEKEYSNKRDSDLDADRKRFAEWLKATGIEKKEVAGS